MENQIERGWKRKTINSIISKKFNDFVASIKDETVRQMVQENSIITGGCIASMLSGKPANDFDIYFANKRTVLAVADYYVKQYKDSSSVSHTDGREVLIEVKEKDDRVKIYIKSAGIASEGETKEYQYFESRPEEVGEEYVNEVAKVLDDAEGVADPVDDTKPKYRPVFMSDNAITLSDKVQIVIRFYGTPEEIHSNFDFIHCTNYWKSSDRKVVLNLEALEAIMAKELTYIGSKYPIASVIRLRKFIGRGWTINAGQILKILFQVSMLDLTKIEVLEEQLVGVDVAYFNQLIRILKDNEEKRKENNQTLNIDMAYITTIIDRLF